MKKTITCITCGRQEEFEGVKENLRFLDGLWECGICSELPAHPKALYPGLTENQAWVWALKYDLNMPNQAIADFLGKSKGAVEVLHTRAKKRIKAMKETLENL